MKDPAVEVARLKALEKAQAVAWPPDMPTVDAKTALKAAEKWPIPVAEAKKGKRPLADTTDAAKKKSRPAPHSWVAPEVHYRTTVYGGISRAELIRALLILAAGLAAALLID